MNHTSIKTCLVAIGTAFTAMVFSMSIGTAPAQAQAYYGNYNVGYHNSIVNYRNAAVTYANGYYYPSYPVSQPVVYQQPVTYVQPTTYVQQPVVYQQPTYVYPAVSASCYAENTSAQPGTSIEWIASATGGTGAFSYNWSGTDGLIGYGSVAYMTYYNPGQKTASVTVYSNGQTISVNCSNSIDVYPQYAYQQPNYIQPVTYVQPTYVQQPIVSYDQPTSAGLDIGCYADPTNATAGQPVTWTAEVTGGIAPYTYSWSGSNGLSGSQSSVTTSYSGDSGDASAIVTVTSANGQSGTHACSNSVAIRNGAPTYAYVPRAERPAQQPAVQNQSTALPAASIFSLSSIPWGWVAVLVILVLFATVMYLLFNRPKI